MATDIVGFASYFQQRHCFLTHSFLVAVLKKNINGTRMYKVRSWVKIGCVLNRFLKWTPLTKIYCNNLPTPLASSTET